MNKRRAYEEITIVHGGNAVTLRPSLRAATILEELHGIPALFRALDDCNLTIISEMILTMTSRQDAAAFLSSIPGRPLLPFFLSVRAPLVELVSMLTPAPDPKGKNQLTIDRPMTWAEIFANFYDRATGILGWTAEQAWNATPTEINRAYWARFRSDDKTDPEQAERNVVAGLDPEFDRAGLHALKGQGRDR
ncbi:MULTISPECIES: hypothetical protein [unclassified Ensifer]|uniref:hypothetical protein n=1 Tax=unclassified Ensifer TaxID=2633371 RepID=UPI00081344A9|nr:MULTISPECIES: hypothetical protein [unclassified Ensifer]OCP17020.1 hypothetical protein BC360_12340 [Ensifer sp. LC163]OCP24151.1 hypothetical protein BC363_23235 [Ensifer sp. LC384]OCP25616.1 hypothetical protein BC361_17460 [Ensifer sp. LC54]